MRDSITDRLAALKLMPLVDILWLWMAGHTASLLAFGKALDDLPVANVILLYFCCGLTFWVFSEFEIYSSWRGRPKLSLTAMLAVAWAVLLLTGILFSFLIRQAGQISRLWLLDWFIIGLFLLLCGRILVYSVLSRMRANGMNSKRVVIVGYGHTGREMHRRAAQQHWSGYDVKAVYTGGAAVTDPIEPSIVQLHTLEGIHDFVVEQKIHEIWITLPLSESAKLQTLQFLLRNSLIDIRWIPDTLSMQILSNKMINFLGLPAVDLNAPVSGDVRGIVKELFDKVFALTVLLLLLPLFIVLAILIKLSSPGPVLFKQPRLGLNGKPFNVYKFRSMKVHAEHGTVTQATQDDPRVTPIGRFIRRTSLDELPQFINVLLGDMSVVGPRPHAIQHNELYKDRLEMYMLRHRVKPGITGWAQIHGLRGETDTDDKMARRVEFDLHYIQNWTFWMDLKIIAWTAFKGWTGNNAY